MWDLESLWDKFGSQEEMFNASLRDLRETTGIGQKTNGAIKSFSQWQQVEEELESARKYQVSIITHHDPLYPKYLLNIYDFSPLLHVKGTLREDVVIVAVIASGAASAYSRFSTERLCRELATEGIVVARIIDTTAHRGRLAGRVRTIAVSGCGIDITYPKKTKNFLKKYLCMAS